ncbi:acetyl-CoA carboxylase biotin carboxyl carrier protein subunit [Streptomyces niveiscabiei]|uniref:acetyl-CoA carboxylase biotin carboxyl carrier protein n=1 Tax=Streptomyces niveiscabiei TaxID=164115 RepID=UPI0029B26A23|nr:biotin/lipoyl-containing protein [Streptomyces niveiscabiei]MDX3386247.1 acetyl-CoA carboxylase biotin carboxyl carrier protein subunit [Streptomyces niveiscabiei]
MTAVHEPAVPEAAADPALVLADLCRSAERLSRLAGQRPSRIHVSSRGTEVVVEWAHPAPPAAAATAAPADPEGVGPDAPPPPHTVRAPTVGTFHHAPAPGAPPFVAPGDPVAPGDQIGIVEAMKLMLPVESDVAGRVVGLLVADGEPVEYDQPVLAVEPDDPSQQPLPGLDE